MRSLGTIVTRWISSGPPRGRTAHGPGAGIGRRRRSESASTGREDVVEARADLTGRKHLYPARGGLSRIDLLRVDAEPPHRR